MIDFVAKQGKEGDINDWDGPIFQEVKGWLIVVGESDVVPALELGIRFLETGQTGRIWSHSKYALGMGSRNHGTFTLPPQSAVVYEVTVTQIVMDTSRLNPYFTIQKALTRKNIANDIYQNEWVTEEGVDKTMAIGRALRLYKRAAQDMETLLSGTYFNQVEDDHPQRIQARQVMMDCLNNIVAVYLRQEEYHKAKESAVEVLKQDKRNLKGLMRAAKAALMDPASTLEEAKAAIEAAEKEVTYKNPSEEKELKRIKAEFKVKEKDYKTKTKEMFANKLKNQTLSRAESEHKSAAGTKLDDKHETGTNATADNDNDNDNDNDEPTSKTENVGTPQSEVAEEATDDQALWKKHAISILFQTMIAVICYFVFHFTRDAGSVSSNGVLETTSVTENGQPGGMSEQEDVIEL